MRKKPKVGILGVGMVGREAMRYFLKNGWTRGRDLMLFDADPQKKFSDDMKKADIIFLCVPTPSAKDGSCDTSIIESAVAKYHHPNRVLVIKSTVEPGTVARLQKKYKSPILFNPEFLTESNAREGFVRPDRQVVGHTAKSVEFADTVLKMLPGQNFIPVNSSEAELAKYGANVFGAVKVAYANILADFAKALEIVSKRDNTGPPVNYENVRKIVAHDKRIGDAWMSVYHGNYRGFGGYCFPKDFKAFISFGAKLSKKLHKKEDKEFKGLLLKSLGVLKAIWSYNEQLLKTQGLTIKIVSSHDEALEEFFFKKK